MSCRKPPSTPPEILPYAICHIAIGFAHAHMQSLPTFLRPLQLHYFQFDFHSSIGLDAVLYVGSLPYARCLTGRITSQLLFGTLYVIF